MANYTNGYGLSVFFFFVCGQNSTASTALVVDTLCISLALSKLDTGSMSKSYGQFYLLSRVSVCLSVLLYPCTKLHQAVVGCYSFQDWGVCYFRFAVFLKSCNGLFISLLMKMLFWSTNCEGLQHVFFILISWCQDMPVQVQIRDL